MKCPYCHERIDMIQYHIDQYNRILSKTEEEFDVGMIVGELNERIFKIISQSDSNDIREEFNEKNNI
jgi:hypothetical protein